MLTKTSHRVITFYSFPFHAIFVFADCETFMQDAPKKNNPLEKNRYLLNCSIFLVELTKAYMMRATYIGNFIAIFKQL